MLLLLFGIICALKNRFLLLCLSWAGFDMLMYVGFGFGLNEVYIMAAHWAFIIPIGIGFLLKHLSPSALQVARLLIGFLTVIMLLHNGW